MAIGIDQFPILSFEQANPLLAGIQAGQQIYGQGVKDIYLQPDLQAALQQQLLNNQILAPKAQLAPQNAQAALQQALLKNQQTQIQNQYLPQQDLAQIALQKAQAGQAGAQAGYLGTEADKNKFLLNNPMMMLPGIAGQLGGYMYLQKNYPQLFNQASNAVNPSGAPNTAASGSFSNPTPVAGGSLNLPQMLLQGTFAPIQKDIAMTQYYQKRANGYNFSQLPADQKDAQIAQAAGLGYEPPQAIQLFNSGMTISDLAKAKGLDPNNLPDPIYPATKSSLNLLQRRNQALSEINTIQPILTQAIAPYSQRFDGYSPAQIADAIGNDNPTQQAQYLAAKALMPEMSALRVKAMNGNVGIEAIREVQNASMGNLKAFGSLVTPQVYQQSQQLLDQWIQQGAQSATKALYKGAATQSYNSNNPQNNSPNSNANTSMTKVLNGKTYTKIKGQWYQQ